MGIIPYTIEEAKLAANSQRIDVYHKELILWLCSKLEKKTDMECNCKEMHEYLKYTYADGSCAEWICPAHGYKRMR